MLISVSASWYYQLCQQTDAKGTQQIILLGKASLAYFCIRQDVPLQCHQLWGQPHLLDWHPPRVRGGKQPSPSFHHLIFVCLFRICRRLLVLWVRSLWRLTQAGPRSISTRRASTMITDAPAQGGFGLESPYLVWVARVRFGLARLWRPGLGSFVLFGTAREALLTYSQHDITQAWPWCAGCGLWECNTGEWEKQGLVKSVLSERATEDWRSTNDWCCIRTFGLWRTAGERSGVWTVIFRFSTKQNQPETTNKLITQFLLWDWNSLRWFVTRETLVGSPPRPATRLSE